MSFCLCQCVREWVTSWPCWELRKTTMRTWWECTPTAPWSWKTWKSPTPWSTRTCPSSRSVSSAGFGLGFSLSVKHTFLFQLIISQFTRQFLDWLLSFPSFNLFIWDLLNTQVFFISVRETFCSCGAADVSGELFQNSLCVAFKDALTSVNWRSSARMRGLEELWVCFSCPEKSNSEDKHGPDHVGFSESYAGQRALRRINKRVQKVSDHSCMSRQLY